MSALYNNCSAVTRQELSSICASIITACDLYYLKLQKISTLVSRLLKNFRFLLGLIIGKGLAIDLT